VLSLATRIAEASSDPLDDQRSLTLRRRLEP
jgi:hypothetical protein